MTKTEIQQAIIDQDWKFLEGKRWWQYGDFVRDSSSFITKEFIMDFLTQDENKDTLFNGAGDILKFIERDNIQFTEADYNVMSSKISDYNRYALQLLIQFTPEKTAEFARYFINSGRSVDLFGNQTTHITEKLLQGLTEDELAAFIAKLSDPSILTISAHTGLVVDDAGANLFNQIEDVNVLIGLLGTDNVDTKITKIAINKIGVDGLFDVLTSGSRNNLFRFRMLSNLSKVDEFSFSDEQVTQLFDVITNKDSRDELTLVLTKEQIAQHVKELRMESVLSRKDISLDEVAKLFPGKRASAPPTEFHTEEEILKYPQFFNPKRCEMLRFYFTRETLKVLNKFWGTRQRYKKDMNGNVTRPLLLHMRSITPEMIRYLETKGTIDWNKIYNQIATHHADDTDLDIGKVAAFLEKYKN